MKKKIKKKPVKSLGFTSKITGVLIKKLHRLTSTMRQYSQNGNSINRRVCPFYSPYIAQSFRMERSGMRNPFRFRMKYNSFWYNHLDFRLSA